MADFGATNKPGTCLFCGEKLRQKYHTTWKSTGKKPRACGGTVNRGTYETKRCQSKDIVKNHTGDWECRECRWTTSGRKAVESRNPVYKELGDFGDGFFCNKGHGYRYAVMTARNGFRLPSRPQPPHGHQEKKLRSA